MIILLSVFVVCMSENIAQTSAIEKKCFSGEEIDFNATSLPKGYQGNNLSLLIDEIEKREGLTKDEFETTPQFRERIEREKSKPLIGELDYGSVFAFQINDTAFQYDADNKTMLAELKLNTVFNWSPICQDKKRHSTATPRETLSAPLPIRAVLPIDLSFEIEIERARKTKPNLRTLLLTRLHAENGTYLSKGRYYTRNTLKVSIQEIWIYDVVTGEIFVKKDSDDIAKLQKHIEEEEKEKRKREVSKANAFYENGRYEEALSALRKVLVFEPMNAEAYLLLGKIHFQREKFEQAVQSLKTALFWDDELIDAHINLGKIYLDKNDCSQAKTYLISALEINNENQEVKALQRQIERCNK